MWGRLQPNALVFLITGRSAEIVGWTPGPRTAPLAGLPVWMRLIPLRRAGPGDPRGPGVRPTISAEFSKLEKRAALGFSLRGTSVPLERIVGPRGSRAEAT